jgi:hypothetical protein
MIDEYWRTSIRDGKSTVVKNAPFHLRNESRREERYFNFTVFPMIDEDGMTIGSYQQVFEVTDVYLKDRRSESIKKIEQFTAGKEDPAEFFQNLMDAVSDNGMPMLLAKFDHLQNLIFSQIRISHSHYSIQLKLHFLNGRDRARSKT